MIIMILIGSEVVHVSTGRVFRNQSFYVSFHSVTLKFLIIHNFY